MKNNATRTIRSEEITIDVRICAALAANRGGEVYLAAIAPDMELTVITLDEAPGILPYFEEDTRVQYASRNRGPSLLWRYKDRRIFGVKRNQNRLVMHHAIAVGKELCLGLVWGMFIVFFQMQRHSRSHLYPAQTGAWTPAPSARCGAATIMWSCTADPTIPPYRERSPRRNIRQRALHITTWRYNFAAKLEIPTRRHLLHPFWGEHRLGTVR